MLQLVIRITLAASCLLTAAKAQAASAQMATTLRQIVEAGRLDDLRWPDFSDYRQHVNKILRARRLCARVDPR